MHFGIALWYKMKLNMQNCVKNSSCNLCTYLYVCPPPFKYSALYMIK